MSLCDIAELIVMVCPTEGEKHDPTPILVVRI
jgi:hypothetical protein